MQGIESVLIQVSENKLKRTSQGQGHKERLQLKRSEQGL